MIIFTAPLTTAFTGTDLYFVRHGETMANKSGVYSNKTLNEFSSKGQAEVTALTAELLKLPKFNLILVSPSPRVLKTIDPYLRKTNSHAIIWPLLYECCTGKRPKDAHPTSFTFGGFFSIPKGMEKEFGFITREKQLPVAPNYDAGLAQVEASVKEFNQFCRGKRVLLVGHAGQGGHMIHELTGKWKKLDNAKLERFNLP